MYIETSCVDGETTSFKVPVNHPIFNPKIVKKHINNLRIDEVDMDYDEVTNTMNVFHYASPLGLIIMTIDKFLGLEGYEITAAIMDEDWNVMIKYQRN